jgi:serine/threonine protein kinase, bacterial
MAIRERSIVYVTDNNNHRVLKLAAGATTQTELSFTGHEIPVAVAVDSSGNVHVTDTRQVLKLTPS